jgi:outer membrane protein TolC
VNSSTRNPVASQPPLLPKKWLQSGLVGLFLTQSGCATIEEMAPRRLPAVESANPKKNQPVLHPVQQAQHTEPPEPIPSPSANESVLPRAITEFVPSVEVDESNDQLAVFDLAQLLATVANDNPQVAFAGERYREAYARLEAAQALWLPSIRAGVSYNKHEGTLQASNGIVSDNSRAALNAGLGVQAVGAGSPVVPGVFANFHLRDAVFQPRIANHRALATLEASRAVTNDLLLNTSLAYLDLLRGKQSLAISQETLKNAELLAKTTGDFARVGQGLQADAARAQTELAVRRNDVHRAEEAIQTATARLTELLSLDPQLQIEVLEPNVVPIDLVSIDSESGQLIAVGLSNRPELAEARQLVCEAVHRYQREKYAPLLPSVLLGVSYSGFGGSDGSEIASFRDRFDLDGVAFWELRNLGFGERAAREESHARYLQERMREVQLMDQVAREIVQAQSQVKSRHRQLASAKEAIQSASDSYQKNVDRIREGQGLPLEALQSMQALDLARREYLRVVTDYNESQFRLHRALGWPIQ